MSQAVLAVESPPRVLADLISRSRARDAALVISAALLTAICAQISIPVPGSPVPITGQTFAVLLAGAALGANRGALAMTLYLGLGLIGLPVYADASSGWEVATGATGGYLFGFVIAAWITGRMAEARLDRKATHAFPLFAVGSLIIFAVGVPWLAVSQDISLAKAADLGLVPFIPGGIVKALAAAALLPSAWRLVGRRED